MVHSIAIPEISFEQAAKLSKNINFDYFDKTGKELIETAKKHGKSVAGKYLSQGLDESMIWPTKRSGQWWEERRPPSSGG
jgi:hypothetical protein